MPASSVVVCADLGLQIGHARAALTPGEAFAVAERLIRAASRPIRRLTCGMVGAKQTGTRREVVVRGLSNRIATFAKSSND